MKIELVHVPNNRVYVDVQEYAWVQITYGLVRALPDNADEEIELLNRNDRGYWEDANEIEWTDIIIGEGYTFGL